jgi:hypothetical protein
MDRLDETGMRRFKNEIPFETDYFDLYHFIIIIKLWIYLLRKIENEFNVWNCQHR